LVGLGTRLSAADVCCYPYDHFLDNVAKVDPGAELIYWQRPDGGRVFNGGSICNGVALYYVALYYKDSVFTGLVKNVLANFLDSIHGREAFRRSVECVRPCVSPPLFPL
jgi:hypothetical protein